MPRTFLLHLEPGLRRPIDPAEIYFLEAAEGNTLVRTRRAAVLVDRRLLGELVPLLEPIGFVRIHRNNMVNPDRIREIRRRKSGEDWEVKLAPPVNRVLPVSRGELKELWKAFGEG